jgi:hypothetical protein
LFCKDNSFRDFCKGIDEILSILSKIIERIRGVSFFFYLCPCNSKYEKQDEENMLFAMSFDTLDAEALRPASFRTYY